MIDSFSGVNDYDYFIIVCNFIVMTNPEFKCGFCKKRFGRDEKKQRQHQERKGCFKPLNDGMFYRPESTMKGWPKITTKRCFGHYFNGGVCDLINTIQSETISLNTPSRIAEIKDLIDNLTEEKADQHRKTQEKLSRGKPRR